MKPRYWSLFIVLLLINYLIFATLFTRLVDTDFTPGYATRLPEPTFTPAPAQPFIIVPTLTPLPVEPTPTATLVMEDDSTTLNSESETFASGSEIKAELVSSGNVNIRSGPGTNYAVVGTLRPNTAMPIIGRNGDASWWKIRFSDSDEGWVSNAVVQVTNTEEVPVVETSSAAVEASAPQLAARPEPAQESPPAESPPPADNSPKYQYSPTGWWDDGNAGLTRFLGDILDVNGSPVNGAFVQASCGDYSTISYPSGPVGWGSLQESHDWPPGFYDITLDTRPIPCTWILTIVDTEDRKTVKARLSESIPVEVTVDKSIIVANWQKNW